MSNTLLYLHPELREIYKREINSFVKFYSERLFPNFANIDLEVKEFSEALYDDLSSSIQWDQYDAGEYVANQVWEDSGELYLELSKIRNTFTGMAIASLFHMLEQQIRRFLYKEMSHDFEIELSKFCANGITEMKEIFEDYQFNLTELKIWDKLDELHLLSNVLKHGDGRSAKKLYERNPDLFKPSIFPNHEKRQLETTLFDENLNIDEEIFIEYSQVCIQFWEEIPERCFFKE